jgi:hypothetical protein
MSTRYSIWMVLMPLPLDRQFAWMPNIVIIQKSKKTAPTIGVADPARCASSHIAGKLHQGESECAIFSKLLNPLFYNPAILLAPISNNNNLNPKPLWQATLALDRIKGTGNCLVSMPAGY